MSGAFCDLPEVIYVVYFVLSRKLVPFSEAWRRMPIVCSAVFGNRFLESQRPLPLILHPCLVSSLHIANDGMFVVDSGMILEIAIIFVP